MNKITHNIFLFCIFLFAVFIQPVHAQGYTDDKRADYIFYAARNIVWHNNMLTDSFRIGVLDTLTIITDKLKQTAQKTPLLNNLPVSIVRFNSLDEIKKTEILFINKYSGFTVRQTVPLVDTVGTITISDYTPFDEAMIDFVEVEDKRRYIVYSRKIELQGLSVNPLFKANAIKTREDWEAEYQKSQDDLQSTYKQVTEFKMMIRQQIKEIEAQQNEIDRQQNEIEAQKYVLNALINDIETQRDTLEYKLQIITQKEFQIIRQNEILEQQKQNMRVQESQIAQQQAVLSEQLQKIKMQQLILYLFIGVILMMISLAFFIYQAYKIKKESNKKLQAANDEITLRNAEITQQKEEIESQRDEIERQRDYVIIQRDQISKQKQEILDSIQYARRIQEAILPPPIYLQNLLADHFVLFKPRDVVSGDFYWVTQKEGQIFIAAADCTGHGVPGAFMSMLGISFLNQIISRRYGLKADQILNKLRDLIIEALHQTGEDDNEAKDGMDISLCIYEKANNLIRFAGAYNPLYLVRDGKLDTIKADRMPIGIHIKMDTFNESIVKIEPKDTIYIFSDGFVDQIGGDRNRKFMSKNFKTLLEEIYPKTMEEQRHILENTLIAWQNKGSQVDDILVMGIRF